MVSIHHGAATQRARLPNWWVNRAQSTSRSRAGGDGHLQGPGSRPCGAQQKDIDQARASSKASRQLSPARPAPRPGQASPERKVAGGILPLFSHRLFATTHAHAIRIQARPALSLSSTCALVCGLNPVGRIHAPLFSRHMGGDCHPLPRNSINKSVMLFASSEIKARGDTEAIELCMLRVTDSEKGELSRRMRGRF